MNFIKKNIFRFLGAIILILLIGILAHTNKLELLQANMGAEKKLTDGPKIEVMIKKSIIELEKFKKELGSLNKNFSRDSYLKKFLDESNEAVNENMASLKGNFIDAEARRLLHIYDHDYKKINDNIEFTKKIVSAQDALSELEKTLNQMVSLKKDSKNSNSTEKIINGLNGGLKELKKSLAEKKYEQFIKKLTDVRLAYIGTIIDLNARLRIDCPLGQNCINPPPLLPLIENLRWILQLRLPSVPTINLEAHARPEVKNILVCMMRWRQQDPTVDQAQLEPVMNEVENWYREISYNQVNLNVQYAGNQLWRGGSLPTDHRSEVNAAVAMCDDFVDFRSIDAMIIFPSLINGFGDAVSSNIETQEGNFIKGVVRINGVYDANRNLNYSLFNPSILEHELGHEPFGLSHANNLECGNQSFRENFADPTSGCFNIEYGNIFDEMGVPPNNINMTGHFTGWGKKLAGNWGNVQHTGNDGHYILSALETPSSYPHTLRIPYRDYSICIEYRKPLLYNAAFSQNAFRNIANGRPGGIPNNGCLFINLCPMDNVNNIVRQRLLIDTTPESIIQGPWDIYDSCIEEGRTFSDSSLGLSTSFQGHSSLPDAAIVNINLDENRLDILADLRAVLIFPGNAAVCTFTAPPYVEIINSSEVDVNNSFTVRIFGQNEQGNEIELMNQTISRLDAGGYIPSDTFNGNGYRSIRAWIDTDNNVQESNENNNEDIFGGICGF